MTLSAGIVFIAVVLVTAPSAQAEASLPKALIIGYPEEGRLEVTIGACTETVNEVVGNWRGRDRERAIIDVCTARQRHLDAYNELQEKYELFRETTGKYAKLADSIGPALNNLRAVVRNCIEYKTHLSWLHNIAGEIYPHTVAAECLKLGTTLLVEKTLIPIEVIKGK